MMHACIIYPHSSWQLTLMIESSTLQAPDHCNNACVTTFLIVNAIPPSPCYILSIFCTQLVNAASYNFIELLQVIVANIALNQTWTAMYIMLTALSPEYSPFIVSAVSAVFGFTTGFFIPVEQLGWWYVLVLLPIGMFLTCLLTIQYSVALSSHVYYTILGHCDGLC